MKPLPIFILLACIISACQKKENSAPLSSTAPTSHITDTPIRKIDSSAYYSAVGDTALYSGTNCDSFHLGIYNNTVSFPDTVLVIRYSSDSIHIINKYRPLWTIDFFQIDNSNFYKSYEDNGYSAFTFSSVDSLSFKSENDNPCGASVNDYGFNFFGKRYK